MHARAILACAALACLCFVLLAAGILILDQRGVARAVATEESARLEGQLTQARLALAAIALYGVMRADGRLGEAVHEVGAWRAEASAQLGAALEETAQWRAAADRRLGEVTAVAGDLRPVLAEASGVLQETRGTLVVLRPQALGLLAAAKVAAGETAQAMRRVDAALPQALVTWEDIGHNVARATEESAGAARESRAFMANLARQTKPLPGWVRIGLAVAPPLVQTGFTTASWLALRGKQR